MSSAPPTTPSVGIMLRDLHGMYHADIQRQVRRRVFPIRLRAIEYLTVKLFGQRFTAENDLVWDLICSASQAQIDLACSHYEEHPSRRSRLIVLLVGSAQRQSFTVFFLELEQQWRARTPR